MEDPSTAPSYQFPTTAWSTVLAAGGISQRESREALGRLLRIYLPALKAFLVRGKGLSRHDAEDLLQGFVCDKVLERDLVASASRSKGRFRSFLLTALERYWIGWLRAQNAQKRMPAGGLAALPEDDAVGAASLSPAEVFDVLWARQVLEEAKRRTREHFDATGQQEIWMIFELRLLVPIMDGAEPVPYAELVKRCRFPSPHQAANALTTAKRAFYRSLRTVLGDSVQRPRDVEDELNHLLEVLRHASPAQY